MSGVRALAMCELRRACRRPSTWFVLAIGSGLLALHFLLLIIRYLEHAPLLRESGVTNEILARYFMTADLSLVIAMPLLTMNIVAGERENGLLRWLYSAPLGSTALVLGKLLGVLGLGLIYVALVAVAPITLYWGAPIDGGVYASNLLGCALFMVLHACLGVLASTLARAPLSAALLALSSGLVLWFIDWASRLDRDADVLGSWSTLSHLRGFVLGLVNTADLAFFVIASALATALACLLVSLERRAA